MIPCLYDEKQHELLSGGEILAWCKRTAPAKDKSRIFLYHHLIHDTFVIAMWASDRAMGIFTDFLNLDKSLNNFTREKANEFRRRLYAPLQADTMAKTINQSAKDYVSQQQNEAGEEKDWQEKKWGDN